MTTMTTPELDFFYYPVWNTAVNFKERHGSGLTRLVLGSSLFPLTKLWLSLDTLLTGLGQKC